MNTLRKPFAPILDGNSWAETLLALAPLAFIPITFTLGYLIAPLQRLLNQSLPAALFTLAILGFFLIAITIGWIKGFPRWVFPYWGFMILVALYLQGFQGDLYGKSFRGSALVWLPLIAVAVIGLLWRRRALPLQQLLTALRCDPTLLSFTLYGALPLLTLASYEEVRGRELLQVIVLFILVGGAYLYMRSRTLASRLASLAGAFSLAWGLMALHQGIYWNGRLETWMTEPTSWTDPLGWLFPTALFLLAALCAPALIPLYQTLTARLKPVA